MAGIENIEVGHTTKSTNLPESVYVVAMELVVLNIIWLAYFLLKTSSDFVALWFEVIFYGFTVSTILLLCCVVSIKLHERQNQLQSTVARVSTALHTCTQSTAVYLVCCGLLFVMLNISLFTGDNVQESWRQWVNGLMFAPGYDYVEPDWLVQMQVVLISVLIFFGLCGIIFCVLSTLQVSSVNNSHAFDLGLAARLNIFLTVVATDAWSRLLTRVCGLESCVYDASDRPFPIDDMHLFELVAWLFGFLLCDVAAYILMKRLSEAVKLGVSDMKTMTSTKAMSKRLLPGINSTHNGVTGVNGVNKSGPASKSGRNLRMRLSGAQRGRNKLATLEREYLQDHSSVQDNIWNGGKRFRTFEKLREIDEQLGFKARQCAYVLFILRCVNFAALLAFSYMYAHIFLTLMQSYLVVAFFFAVIVTAIVDTVKLMHRVDMHIDSNTLEASDDANSLQTSDSTATSKSLAVDLLYEPEQFFGVDSSHEAYNPSSRFVESIVKKDS